MAKYEVDYANAEQINTGAGDQIFAGDTPPVSTQPLYFDAAAVAAALPQFTPLMKNAAGKLIPWVAVASGTPNTVFAVSCYELPVGTDVTKPIAVYTEAMFNIQALNWPSGVTEEQANAGMNAGVKYRRLLRSDKRGRALSGANPVTGLL